MKAILSKSTSHLSFLIMCAGSGVLFLSNILAKNFLSTQDYLSLSYIITITTILSSFALGGMEQLIIRFGTNDNNKITIDKTSSICIIAALITAILISPITINIIFPNSLSIVWIFLLTLSFCLALINYNISRIKSRFIEAQISSNAWKFALFSGVAACILWPSNDFENTLLSLIAGAAIFNIYLSIINIKSLTITRNQSSTLSTGLAFSFSLAIMTVLGTFDRVLAEKFSGPSLFTEYVYFSMILIYPFNMIASYIGFREAVIFKTNFSKNLIRQKAWKLLIKISFLFLLFGGCVYSLSSFINLKLTWLNMLLCYLLICTKCIYSIFSAVMGSRASASEIWKSNLFSAAAIIAISGIYFSLSQEVTLNSLLSLFIALWASRTIIFTYMVFSNENA
ncbi:hypothetical protein [Pseudomonas violetae]|uniref:Polysaccharide biosynthesis protein n=1 Tax=Pseudomonas violetae TaxID=2915813 RepID=A0ABT0F6P4_9PSED|nr:hypothetical protein [Pseudomonas violetae]MCK1793686.1 hypothetical protein [Pseudomonas violetae]